MSWAAAHIAGLSSGSTVQFRPRGTSMAGLVEDGQLVTVEPATYDSVKKGDVVLCKVQGQVYLHLVLATTRHAVQIGNNRGRVNGWTSTIYGRMVY